jgi:hypothetical protein
MTAKTAATAAMAMNKGRFMNFLQIAGWRLIDTISRPLNCSTDARTAHANRKFRRQVPLCPTRERLPACRKQRAEAEHLMARLLVAGPLIAGDPSRRGARDPNPSRHAFRCRGRGGRGSGRRRIRLWCHCKRLARRGRKGSLRCDGRGWRDDRRLAGVVHNGTGPFVHRMDANGRAIDVRASGIGNGSRQVPIDQEEQCQQHAAGVCEVSTKRHGARPNLSPPPAEIRTENRMDSSYRSRVLLPSWAIPSTED